MCVAFLAEFELVNAIELTRNHGVLFKFLQVTVSGVKTWHVKEVERNLQGGKLTLDINSLSPWIPVDS